jgi:hypothetical protein
MSRWIAGALAIALGVAGCSDAGRAGTLATNGALPTVTCSTGVGGVLTVSNIPSTLYSMGVTWNFGSVPGEQPFDRIGLVNPATGAPTPSDVVISLSSPPWASTKSTSTPGISILHIYTDGSSTTRSVSCSKGSDSPTPTITCQSKDPGSVGLNSRVNILTSGVSSLGANAKYVEADWWWKGVEIWQVVLNPWISAIPDAWTSVAFAEHTEHNFDAGSTSEYQSFESTPDLALPTNFAGGYIGHVRVRLADERRRPTSFPAEVDCP